MSGQRVDLNTWPRADQFRFFKTFDRPHYAVTARIDVTHLMAIRKKRGLNVFRTSIWAIGAGLHAVPELRMRFLGNEVTIYDRLTLSPTIALDNGDFRYVYLPWEPDREAFDIISDAAIDKVRQGEPLKPNEGRLDMGYLSCMPWLDYTSLDNALPNPDDCIPRVSWGKIVPKGDGFDMAVTIQVHHALVDGRQVGDFFDATQSAVSDI